MIDSMAQTTLPTGIQYGNGFILRGALQSGWGLGLGLLCGPALAQDRAGAKDHRLVKRHAGSSIAASGVVQFLALSKRRSSHRKGSACSPGHRFLASLT
jgi:hypothetical protein